MNRVLIADDDPLTRAGIEVLLANSFYEIVASVSDGDEVLRELPTSNPDLLVLDLNMPSKDGIAVLRHLRERDDQRPIILLTGGLSGQRAWEALQIGLNGLVIKAKAPATLVKCLDAVKVGRRWIDQDILAGAMEVSLSSQGERRGAFASLTPKEFAVVNLVRRGLRNKEIADGLHVSDSTIKSHLHSIFDKTKVRNRSELILLAEKDPAFGNATNG